MQSASTSYSFMDYNESEVDSSIPSNCSLYLFGKALITRNVELVDSLYGLETVLVPKKLNFITRLLKSTTNVPVEEIVNIVEFLPLDKMLSMVHNLLKPHSLFVTTTPYDYNREVVYNPDLNGRTLRNAFEKSGFEITIKTKKESYIPWILKVNERTYLFYFLDLVEASKVSKHKH